MEISRQLFRLALLGAINHQITHIVVQSGLFEDTRAFWKSYHPKLGQLITCHLCFGTWVGFLLALLFRPRLVELARAGTVLQPTPMRKAVGFVADSLAIALAGRFFTEVFGILSGQVAVEREHERLIEEQVREHEVASGEPLTKPIKH
jgi:hypothetical protein